MQKIELVGRCPTNRKNGDFSRHGVAKRMHYVAKYSPLPIIQP